VSARSTDPKARPASSALVLTPRVKRLLAAAAVLLGLLSVGSRVRFSLSVHGVTNDFTQDYVAARAWSDGKDPYELTSVLVKRYLNTRASNFDIDPYNQRTPHPPAMIGFFQVVSWMPYNAARITWLFLMSAISALGFGFLAHHLGVSRKAAWVVAIGTLAIPVVQTDLTYGQSNGLLAILLIVAWLALKKDADRTAGISLGVATALKLFPLFMVLPLIRLRRTRALIWDLATFAVASVLSGLVIGGSRTSQFLRHVSADNFRFWRGAPFNLSILSVPYRWLTRSIWRPHAPDLSLVCLLIVGVLALCLVAAPLLTPAPLTGDVFWEAIPFMLLAVPTLWETYLVLMVPVAFLIFKRIRDGEMRVRWVVIIALALSLIGLFPGLPPALKTSAVVQVLGFSWAMYGLVVLAVASFVLAPLSDDGSVSTGKRGRLWTQPLISVSGTG
jgi:MFS family permease